MKSIKRILISLAIAAMASFGVQAATLDKIYTSTDNKVFSVEHVNYIDAASGALTLTYDTGVVGSVGYFADTGGTVTSKLLASGKWVKDPTSGRYVHIAAAHTILCNASIGQTTFYFLATSAVPIADGGCAIYAQIKANGN